MNKEKYIKELENTIITRNPIWEDSAVWLKLHGFSLECK